MASSSVGDSSNYSIPGLPILLSSTSFLYLLRVAEHLSDQITNAHLLGSLLVGILWANPHVGDLLTPEIISTFTLLGYIGLLLLIFAAGLTTPLDLLLNASNLILSMLVAITGIAVPFALTFALLHGGYGYTVLQAFGAGAALCSTSLGTTTALLDDEMQRKRVGVVLMTAALADDVVGLVIASIVANLGTKSAQGIHWSTIVRPILASLAFTFFTPVIAITIKRVMPRALSARRLKVPHITKPQAYLFTIIATLTAFVAVSHYAGTSELYGAYLAGTFLSYVFEPKPKPRHGGLPAARPVTDQQDVITQNSVTTSNPILLTFTQTLDPLLTNLLSPLFFASIGASLPVQNLFTVRQPLGGTGHDVIWKGLVYSLLMIIAKVATGVWILVWPQPADGGPSADANIPASDRPTSNVKDRIPSALFLGLAMVARGEIALIVAQLARPLLTSDVGSGVNEEPFAVVIWAILVTTVCGAVSVGVVLRTTMGRRLRD